MVNLPVSMIPDHEWYLEIILITIEYHSVGLPLKFPMVHLPVSMIPEWYLEIILITIEYHSVPLKFPMVYLPVAMIPEWYLEIAFITSVY